MDGYSVTEAASVLGVPTERVWELLARGVLSGRPEGESGMRVFLQPRPQPAAPAPTPDEAAGRGNGSERTELSPFRELLTEFRNLTERYGQALLALGEARGEVASLRSRVDVLEARMELRLPFAPQAGTAAWPMTSAPTEPPPAPPSAEEDEADAHRSRRRGARRATESFAEALARAEDPSIPDLPPATAAPPADRAVTEPPAVPEPSLPREVAPAEPMPVADEPELIAADEGVTDLVETGDLEPAGEQEPSMATAVEVAPPPVQVPPDDEPVEIEPPVLDAPSAPPAEVDVEGDDGHLDDAVRGDVESTPAEAADIPDGAPDPEAAAVDARDAEPQPVEPTEEDGPAEPAPVDFDEDRYTTAIELPDWFAAEVEPSDTPEHFEALPHAEPVRDEPSAVAEELDPAAPPPSDEAEGDPVGLAPSKPDLVEPTAPEPAPEASAEPEAHAATAPEPADESGADEMEIAPAAAPVPARAEDRPPAATVEPDLPGSSELDEALAALDELRRRTSTAPVRNEWSGPSAGSTASVSRTSDIVRPRPAMTAGPATRAYRRLRRIFPD